MRNGKGDEALFSWRGLPLIGNSCARLELHLRAYEAPAFELSHTRLAGLIPGQLLRLGRHSCALRSATPTHLRESPIVIRPWRHRTARGPIWVRRPIKVTEPGYRQRRVPIRASTLIATIASSPRNRGA